MDLVTKNLLDTFRREFDFPDDIKESTLFEHFSNYCVISYEYPDDYDVDDILVAGGNDLQLDGVGIIVNGVLTDSVDAIDDLLSTNRYIDAKFILIQAKSGKNFEGSEISNMFYGIRDLFESRPTLPRNNALNKKAEIINHIYSKSASFKNGNPKLKIYYVTTGKWEQDSKLVSRISNEISTLEELIIFENPEFFPVDAKELQKLYKRSKNVITKTINFANKINLPSMDGIRESYLGYIPVMDYIDLITDENNNLARGLFYDNVRDFQGDNPVNREIEQTLNSEDKEAFILLNNGVTIVAEDRDITSTKITLRGFQVVNGCQTSHVLFNNKGKLNEKMFVAVKLIIEPNSNLKNQVIKATNRQTVVKTEELSALTDFQKHLEEFYNAIPQANKLYYERRSQQFNSGITLEKIRIITVPSQIRSFASMFLGRAHQASRYYGTLLKDIEGKIFVDGHVLLAYYVSAYSLFTIEYLLRKKVIDAKYRPFKFHILSLLRIKIAGKEMPSMSANQFEKYCEKIKYVMWSETLSLEVVNEVCKLLDKVLDGNYDRDRAKDSTIESQAFLS